MTLNYYTNQKLSFNITLTWLGYSVGSLRANEATFTSGGQCEDGVKMIIAIGEIEVPTSDGKKKN